METNNNGQRPTTTLQRSIAFQNHLANTRFIFWLMTKQRGPNRVVERRSLACRGLRLMTAARIRLMAAATLLAAPPQVSRGPVIYSYYYAGITPGAPTPINGMDTLETIKLLSLIHI